MKSRHIGILASLLIACTAANADGNALLDQCSQVELMLNGAQTTQDFKSGLCLGLVQGVSQTTQIMERFMDKRARICWPSQSGSLGITNGQAVRVVLKFLRENPALLHENEVSLTFRAFREAYPCPK